MSPVADDARTVRAATTFETVRIREVYLAGDTPKGPVVVGDMALEATAEGLTVLGPREGAGHTFPWAIAGTVSFRQTAELPDGRPALVFDITLAHRRLAFMVPASLVPPARAAEIEERITKHVAAVTAAGPAASAGVSARGGTGSGAGAPHPALPPLPPAPRSAPAQDPAVASLEGARSLMPDLGRLSPSLVQPLPPGAPAYLSALSVATRRRRHRLAVRLSLTAVLVAAAGTGAALTDRATHQPAPISGASLVPEAAAVALAQQTALSPADYPPGWQVTASGALAPLAGGPGGVVDPAVSAGPALLLAQCLHAPLDAIDRVVLSGGGLRIGQAGTATSALEIDPADAGISASSTVTVASTPSVVSADAAAMTNPDLGACLTSYLTSVAGTVPAGRGAAGLTTYLVSSVPLAAAPPSGVRAVGFEIDRVVTEGGQASTTAMDVVFVWGGKVEAWLTTVGNLLFPVPVQSQLLQALESGVAAQPGP